MAAALPYKIAVLCDLRDERGRVLLIRRAKPPNQGLYSMIGGKLDTESGESPAQCARREIEEEAGVDVPIERLRLVGLVSEAGFEGETHWLMFIYRVQGPVAVEARTIREGSLEWHEESAVSALPLPETDRKVFWPLLQRQQGRFFAVHIDCTGGDLVWTIEQADGPAR
jgi:8-oxo-dGTP diphosphatase